MPDTPPHTHIGSHSWFYLKPILTVMDPSNFHSGRVHCRNKGIYVVCYFGFYLTPLFTTMEISNALNGCVHYRNTGVMGLSSADLYDCKKTKRPKGVVMNRYQALILRYQGVLLRHGIKLTLSWRNDPNYTGRELPKEMTHVSNSELLFITSFKLFLISYYSVIDITGHLSFFQRQIVLSSVYHTEHANYVDQPFLFFLFFIFLMNCD